METACQCHALQLFKKNTGFRWISHDFQASQASPVFCGWVMLLLQVCPLDCGSWNKLRGAQSCSLTQHPFGQPIEILHGSAWVHIPKLVSSTQSDWHPRSSARSRNSCSQTWSTSDARSTTYGLSTLWVPGFHKRLNLLSEISIRPISINLLLISDVYNITIFTTGSML